MSSYNYMDREEFEDYNKFASSSVRSKGAETITNAKKGTKRTSKEKRELKIKRLKKRASRFLIIVMVILGLIKGVDYTVDYASRHIAYNNALEDFRPKLVQYLAEAEVDFAISKDKKIVILENNVEDIQKLQDVLNDKVGLDSHQTAYVLSKICGDDAFEKSVQSMGYDDGDEFLRDNYPSGPLSSSGSRYLAKYPDKKKFENNQENGVYEKLTELQEKEEARIQEYLASMEKGMSK